MERLEFGRQLEAVQRELLDLVWDNDIFWRMQAVINSNPNVIKDGGRVLDLIRISYGKSACVDIRRLTEKRHRSNDNLSLRTILDDLSGLSSPPIAVLDIANDIQALTDCSVKIAGFVDRRVAHNDWETVAPSLIWKDLNSAISTLVDIFRKYNSIIRGTDSDLSYHPLEDPMRVFDIAWRPHGSQ